MSNIVDFKKAKSAKRKQVGKHKTLCSEGHHKWEVLQDKQFDTQQGRLVTIYQCKHCKKRKTKLL